MFGNWKFTALTNPVELANKLNPQKKKYENFTWFTALTNPVTNAVRFYLYLTVLPISIAVIYENNPTSVFNERSPQEIQAVVEPDNWVS